MRTLKIYTTLMTMLLALMFSTNSKAQCTSAFISTSPTTQNICVGTNTFFSVNASGTTLTYQWQVNNWLGGGYVNITDDATYFGSNTSVLQITNAQSAMNGYGYRCRVVAACGSPVISLDAGLNIFQPHAILSHPTSQTVCPTNNATFSVYATGWNISYNWQISTNSGVSYANLPNTPPYSGVNTNNLTVSSATSGMNGHIFRCHILSNCGAPVLTNTAGLNVNVAPSFLSQPSSTTACIGSQTSFTVTTQNVSNYQWQVSTNSGGTWANIGAVYPYANMQTNSLTITNVDASFNNYQYRCIASGNCTPVAISNPATLSLFATPSISSQPSSTAVCQDGATSFSVTASGTAINYQWQVALPNSSTYTNIGNVFPYGGMQSPTLSIINTPLGFNGNSYRCVVSGTCSPAAISTDVILTVNGKPTITVQPTNQTACEPSINNTFSITATGAGLIYQWQTAPANTSAFTNVSNGSLYSGATTNSLAITNGTLALQGQIYRCVVSGTCLPVAISNTAVLNINIRPTVSINPTNITTCENGNAVFSTTATGTGLVYQWQRNNGGIWVNTVDGGSAPAVSGSTTNALSLTGVTNAMNGFQYRCMITGTCTPPPVFTSTVNLTVNPLTVINTSPVPSTICAGSSTSFSVAATGSGLTYQWQADNGGGYVNLSNTAPYANVTGATLNIAAVPASLNNVVYRCAVGSVCGPLLNSGGALLTVNTSPTIIAPPANLTVCSGNPATFGISATGTSLSYQWQINTGSGFSNLIMGGFYSLIGNNLNISSTTPAMSGFIYRVQVSGTCTPPVFASASLTVNTPPAITVNTNNEVVCNGGNATFSINATGSNLTYQWQQFNGSVWVNMVNGGTSPTVYGATTSILTNTGVTTAMNGSQYRCIINGVCPITPLTGNTGTLTVNTPPSVVTPPSATTVCQNGSSSFTVVGAGTALGYQWQVQVPFGSFVNLTSAAPYSGANSATLNIAVTPLSFNGNRYRCVLSGSCPSNVTSTDAQLTVNALTVITSNPTASNICRGGSTTFSVTATSATTYQWQVNNNSSWSNVSNGGIYANANSSTLSISGADTTVNTYQYRCIIGGLCAPLQTSLAAMLRVTAPPVFTSQPANVTVCNGNGAAFTVNATSGATYRWQMLSGTVWINIPQGGIYSGLTSSTMQVANIPYSMHGTQYRCIASNGCAPDAISAVATLSVFSKPVILTSTAADTVCENTQAVFAVTVDAFNPTYQWQEDRGTGWSNLTNGVNYSLVNSATLQVSNVTLAMSGYGYRCIVSSTCGTNTGGPGILYVDPKPRITKHPTTSKLTYNEPTKFSVDATGKNLTYQWQVDSMISGNVVYVNINDKPNAYSGTNTRELTVLPKAGYMNLRSYRCVVSGLCALPETSNPAKMTVVFATGINNVTGERFEVKVYPNPVNGNTLFVQTGNYNGGGLKVKITSNLGAVVADQHVTLQNNTGSVNIANLPAGIYNLHVSDAENSTLQVLRFVKQ